MKRRQKASFLGSISFKITVTKEKERRKRNSEEEERRRREKAIFALLVFITATLEIAFGRKKKTVERKKVHLAVTFSKIRLEDLSHKMSNVCHLKLPKMAHFQRLAKFFGNI